MQFSFEFSHSAENIYEKLTDPQFIVDRCIALGSIDASCDSDGEELPQLQIARSQNADVPSLMKKIVGDQQDLETIEQWSETEDTFESHSSTKVAGTPITIKSAQSLYNLESGSEIEVELTVTAKIPLVRKKVEAMVASKIRQEILREFEYLEST